jgi:glutamyl-Q tRNA(Asp) synthetase
MNPGPCPSQRFMSAEHGKLHGRFAPTPSGPLHFGSLVTAVASYCQARAHHSAWYVRIEDLDTPRVVPGSADQILRTLDDFGFDWDGEVVYQSQRFDAYQAALDDLIQDKLVYACECSRKSLIKTQPKMGPLGMIYPANCRAKGLPIDSHTLRLDLQQVGQVGFEDAHYGHYTLDLTHQVGDVVLKRVDGVFAYHLAVVLDDDWQGIRQIVRGADLLPVTPLHCHLYNLLGFEPPGYLHLPLARNAQGKKLSKQTGATALRSELASQQLVDALRFLGQTVDETLRQARPAQILRASVDHWNAASIPPVDTLD